MLNIKWRLAYLISPLVLQCLQALHDVDLYNYISEHNDHVMLCSYYYTNDIMPSI